MARVRRQALKGAVIGALWAVGLRKAEDCPGG
jgi:hypothetical protein